MSHATEIHPFEKAGLGIAPFRYVGMVFQDIEYGRRRINSRDSAVSVTTAPGGTCDACGTYIVDMYRIKSSDGIESKVGCDCILKVGTKVEALPKFKADLKKAAKAKREIAKGKEALRIEAAKAALLADPAMFTDKPHPVKFRAEQGASFRDYVEWMMSHAGHSGRFSMCKLIEKAAK